MSPKTQERLLYLISPIGLIALWQILLMAGIGDRRFVPAPSDIAYDIFVVKLATPDSTGLLRVTSVSEITAQN